MKHLLIVEPDVTFRTLLEETGHSHAAVEAAADFATARARLFAALPDLVVTNLRLGAFNGIHLAIVLASADRPWRAVVYNDGLERSLAREAQRAGAFYEDQWRLPYALPAYLDANLPPLDRRDPQRPGRRSAYRGGRRASDIPGLDSGTVAQTPAQVRHER